jgi:hypothetical protein
MGLEPLLGRLRGPSGPRQPLGIHGHAAVEWDEPFRAPRHAAVHAHQQTAKLYKSWSDRLIEAIEEGGTGTVSSESKPGGRHGDGSSFIQARRGRALPSSSRPAQRVRVGPSPGRRPSRIDPGGPAPPSRYRRQLAGKPQAMRRYRDGRRAGARPRSAARSINVKGGSRSFGCPGGRDSGGRNFGGDGTRDYGSPSRDFGERDRGEGRDIGPGRRRRAWPGRRRGKARGRGARLWPLPAAARGRGGGTGLAFLFSEQIKSHL